MKRPPLELTVRTEKIVHGGQALARDDRFVVFVDDALPNETVRTRIYKKKKKFAFGRAIEVLEASPDRVDPDCPWAGDCGGCTYRHCVYSAQLRFKQEVLAEALHGVHCVAAPVLDRQCRPVAAITVTGPDERLRKEDFARTGEWVRACAREVSEQIA